MGRPSEASVRQIEMPKKRPAKKVPGAFRRDANVEDRIVDATVRCFRQFGIQKTAMDDIAKVAKVSRPTIYRYFPSRHHLVVEVLVREIRDHTRVVAPVLRETKYPPRALLDGIVLAFSSALEHPYTRIVTSDEGAALLSRVPGSDQILLDAMSEQWLPALNRWHEQGYLKKEILLNDLLLWITFYLYTVLGKADFMAITEQRLRRMIQTLLIPAIFDFDKLGKDFPRER